jgi:hypothetical protein
MAMVSGNEAWRHDRIRTERATGAWGACGARVTPRPDELPQRRGGGGPGGTRLSPVGAPPAQPALARRAGEIDLVLEKDGRDRLRRGQGVPDPRRGRRRAAARADRAAPAKRRGLYRRLPGGLLTPMRFRRGACRSLRPGRCDRERALRLIFPPLRSRVGRAIFGAGPGAGDRSCRLRFRWIRSDPSTSMRTARSGWPKRRRRVAAAVALHARPPVVPGGPGRCAGAAVDRAARAGRSRASRRYRGHLDLADIDVVWLRQDPPFDMGYITTTHILDRLKGGRWS